jgi:Rrf2 family nitric oxide-sensitive transcriptional repressor
MRLTAFTDYSLRVLIYLAIHRDDRATIAEIGNAFGVSEHHLVKVVHFLGKAGFLANVRGRGGGLRLASPPNAINIGAVVRQTEPKPMPAECFDRDTNSCPIAPVCRLGGVLSEAVAAFYSILDRYTLEDVVSNRRALAKILFIPPAKRRAGSASALRRQ